MSASINSFLRQMFTSLRGRWNFTRTMGIEGENVQGSAKFQVCQPSAVIQQYFASISSSAASSAQQPANSISPAGHGSPDLLCLHYSEEGEWKQSTGSKFTVRGSHEYFYTLHLGKDLVVFKQQSNELKPIFMYALTFNQRQQTDLSSSATTVDTPISFPFQAVGRHFCACTDAQHAGKHDIYDATYDFRGEQEFNLRFLVNGPMKSQMIDSHFSRVLHQEASN